MILVQRHYELKDTKHCHANIEVNPTGVLDVKIVELNKHHQAELCDIEFQKLAGKTCLRCKNEQAQWMLELDDKDANELSTLIVEANEEYETLMRDL